MLPTSHLLITAACAVPVALLTGQNGPTTAFWAATSGVISAAIDLDVYIFVLLESKRHESLKPFRNFVNIYRRFGLFMETIYQTGIVRKAMQTHFMVSILLCFLAWFFARPFFLPVLIAVVTHLASDAPHWMKIVK